MNNLISARAAGGAGTHAAHKGHSPCCQVCCRVLQTGGPATGAGTCSDSAGSEKRRYYSIVIAWRHMN